MAGKGNEGRIESVVGAVTLQERPIVALQCGACGHTIDRVGWDRWVAMNFNQVDERQCQGCGATCRIGKPDKTATLKFK